MRGGIMRRAVGIAIVAVGVLAGIPSAHANHSRLLCVPHTVSPVPAQVCLRDESGPPLGQGHRRTEVMARNSDSSLFVATVIHCTNRSDGKEELSYEAYVFSAFEPIVSRRGTLLRNKSLHCPMDP